MPWVRFEDNFANHPKVAPLSHGAFRIWVTMIAYSNRYGLDGEIKRSQVDSECHAVRGRNRAVAEIVEAGLWHDTNATRTRHELDTNSTRTRHELDTNSTRTRPKLDTVFLIHDIGDYQPTSDKSAEISKKRSEAGRKGAESRWKSDGKLPMAKNAPDPTRPDPTRIHTQQGVRPSSVSSGNGSRTREVKAVFDEWSKRHPGHFPTPHHGLKEWREIERRLADGCSVDQLRRAVDGIHYDDWEGRSRNLLLWHVVKDLTAVQRFEAMAGGGEPEAPREPTLEEMRAQLLERRRNEKA